MRRPLLLALAAGLLAGCGSSPVPGAAGAGPSPVAAAAPSPLPEPVPSLEPSPVPSPVWVVGASPLPLRPDGFGEVLTTPELLRDRRMTDPGVLPPPADGDWVTTASPVSTEIRERMGETWSRACPVALEDLRYLTVSFRGFDGAAHTGELVVNADVAADVTEVFRRLFSADFPIEQMRLPTTADLQAPPTGDGNNSASYVCRAARGQTTWSQHAYGRAVDINPFHNPLVKRDLVIPELAGAYADRADVRPGMHVDGGAVVEAFSAVGWTWGGRWRSSKDYMHFSQNGQ